MVEPSCTDWRGAMFLGIAKKSTELYVFCMYESSNGSMQRGHCLRSMCERLYGSIYPCVFFYQLCRHSEAA